MIEGRREGGRDEHRGRKIKTEEETKARKGREGKGRGREGKGEQKEKKETEEEVAGPYLDTKATQREERDQGTIGRCGTRVVPASTNRHRRPPPMPGPIHRSGLAKRKAFEPSPGSEDPCRSLLSLSLSLFFPFAASRLLSFLFLQVNQPAWRTRNLLANYPCTTWTNLTRVLQPDPFRILCLRGSTCVFQ